MNYEVMTNGINLNEGLFEGQCKFEVTAIKVSKKLDLILSIKTLFILISFSCAGCVAPPQAENTANQDKVQLARANLLACGRSLLPKIDDGGSSAEVVASTIPTLCKDETNKLLNLVVPNTADYRVKEDVKREYFSAKSFVPIVLQYRANKNDKTNTNFATSSPVPSRYSECLFQLGKAWCSVGAGLDLVKRSMSDSCKEEKNLDEKAIRDNYEMNKDLTNAQQEKLVHEVIKSHREWALREYELYCKYK